MAVNLQEFLQSGAFYRAANGSWWLGWGALERAAKPSPGKCWFFSPEFNDLSGENWFSFASCEEVPVGDLQKVLEQNPNPEMRSVADIKALANLKKDGYLRLVDWEWQAADRGEFSDLFAGIQKQFSETGLEKLVPLTYESSSSIPNDELIQKIIHRLLIIDEGLTPYGFWQDGSGMIGVTPELLFSSDGKSLNTMALAGTRPSSDSGSLLDDEKEVDEHNFVVNGLKAQLVKFGELEISKTEEWDIGLLTHLRTNVSVNLQDGVNVSDVIQAMHPTPALGGTPKDLAVKWLGEQKFANARGKYGAPFGIQMPEGNTEISVAIRGFQWNGNQSFIYSGCGIVAASDEEKEWQELFAKRKSVKVTLGL